MHFLTRLLIAAYLVEAGIVLILAPWTRYWDRNFFAYAWPWLADVMANEFVQGGVTGVGLITVLAGLRDLVGAFLLRQPSGSEQPGLGPGQ